MKHFLTLLLLLVSGFVASAPEAQASEKRETPAFIVAGAQFEQKEREHFKQDDLAKVPLMERIAFRAKQQPIFVWASAIFGLAILHTFLAIPITNLAHKVQHRHDERIRRERRDAASKGLPDAVDDVSFPATILHFLGEVEAIFGIWVVVLMAAIGFQYDWKTVTDYIGGSVNFTEPMFVVIIMALASTRPILRLSEDCMRSIARIGKESVGAWWLSILIVAPLLGSLITEPAAMTIAALLLAKKFYSHKPSNAFAYATLGLLFVNVSIGGTLTNFAAPPVIMAAEKWKFLTNSFMLQHFGLKAFTSITVSSIAYWLYFRKELAAIEARAQASQGENDAVSTWSDRAHPIPFWVTLVNILFVAWTVLNKHDTPLFVGGFLMFMGFSAATFHHQNRIEMRGPIMVGFFLAGLVIHGTLQEWWLAPTLSGLSEWPAYLGATFLTSFNDNAAITYLASLVQGLSNPVKCALLAGAVTGGGLTVIANAPNPAGQSILGKFFRGGINPIGLLLGAVLPTLVASIFFMLLPDKAVHEGAIPDSTATIQAEHVSTHAKAP